MSTNSIERKVDELKKSIDIIILIELVKVSATRKEVREVLGSLDNNMFARINVLFNNKNKK